MATTLKNNRYVKPVAFSSLSASARRVAIAKDVIAGLKAKRLKAKTGYYIQPEFDLEVAEQLTSSAKKETIYANSEFDVQAVLKTSMKACSVCAKGAIFIAAVEKFDRLKVNAYAAYDVLDEYADSMPICDTLVEQKLFSQAQLDLIEQFFEGWADEFDKNDPKEAPIRTALIKFKRDNRTAETRMIAIMKNIIKNEGTFVPVKVK